MRRIYYSIAVVLAVAWIMSLLILRAGGPIHALAFLSGICWVHGTITMPHKKYMLGNGEQDAEADK